MINNISNTFDLFGKWWLPHDKAIRKPGHVFFNPNGSSKLKLQDSFFTSIDDSEAEFICGKLNDGRFCTLIDCFAKNITSYFGSGDTSSEIIFNQSYIGTELIISKDQLYESAALRFSYLNSWVNKSPFINHYKPKDACVVEYKPIKEIQLSLKSINAKLIISTNPLQSFNGYKIKLSHQITIFIHPRKKQKLCWYLDLAYNLRILFTLLIGKPVSIKEFNISVRKRRDTINGRIRYIRTPGSFLFHQIGQITDLNEYIHPRDIAFPLTSIDSSINTIFNNWITKANSLQSFYDLFFIVSIESHLPIDFKFLTLIQGIEAYDRYSGSNKYIEDIDYQPIFRSICSSLPPKIKPDHRDALIAKLKFGNEFSLRKRFKNILNRMDPNFINQININNINDFIEKVVDTRNYLIHRDESNKGNILNDDEKFLYSESLHIIIIYLLCVEIGIPIRDVTNRLTNPKFLRN